MYIFRVFVQDARDYDNDQDEWVSFDSVSVATDFGPRDPHLLQGKIQEEVELQEIAIHKRFRAVIHKDADVQTLRALVALNQQELIVATDIELHKYDYNGGRNSAILLTWMTFNSKIIDHTIDCNNNYDFQFQIVGAVELGDGSEVSAPQGIAEEETQVARRPRRKKRAD